MAYDLFFFSYTHQGDNTSREAGTALVARLHAQLEAVFRRRLNRDLEILFDKEDIQDFDHWQVRCHLALCDSQFFVACLSRTYLRSDACRWEWEEWCRHELEHGLVGQGAASLWFVKLGDLDAPVNAALLRGWKGDLLQRFHIQCHEWRHDAHGNFLDAAARSELRQLTEHVAQRLRLLALDCALRGNFPWPNVNFVGREPELARLCAALLANRLRSFFLSNWERHLIVIDAGDEASETGRNPVVEISARNTQQLPDCPGLGVTSRPEFDVKTPLQALNPFPRDIQSGSYRADIRYYLGRELATLLRHAPTPPASWNKSWKGAKARSSTSNASATTSSAVISRWTARSNSRKVSAASSANAFSASSPTWRSSAKTRASRCTLLTVLSGVRLPGLPHPVPVGRFSTINLPHSVTALGAAKELHRPQNDRTREARQRRQFFSRIHQY